MSTWAYPNSGFQSEGQGQDKPKTAAAIPVKKILIQQYDLWPLTHVSEKLRQKSKINNRVNNKLQLEDNWIFFVVQSVLTFSNLQVLHYAKKSASCRPHISSCSLFFPGFSEPFLPVGPPCSCDVVLIKALLSCCDSSDIVYWGGCQL